MQAVTPPLEQTPTAVPTRLPLRRRMLRRAAWVAVDLGATAVCAVVLLKAVI